MADIRRKGKVSPGPGQPPKDAELMEVNRSDEKWSVYTLDDGTELRMKTLVTEVWRVIDEFDAEGNPMYIVKAQGAMSVLTPEPLKRAKQ